LCNQVVLEGGHGLPMARLSHGVPLSWRPMTAQLDHFPPAFVAFSMTRASENTLKIGRFGSTAARVTRASPLMDDGSSLGAKRHTHSSPQGPTSPGLSRNAFPEPR